VQINRIKGFEILTSENIKILFLVMYHVLFAYFAFFFILKKGGDAMHYWFIGENLSEKDWQNFFKPGTDTVRWLVFPLVKYFHFPFWSGFLIFSLFSSLGVVLLYQIMKEISGRNAMLKFFSIVLLLLPNLHFWSSLIGKEAVLLPFFVLIVFKLKTKEYFSPVIFGTVLFVSLIRPHVGFVLILSYILSLLFVIKTTTKLKIILITVFVAFTIILAVILVNIQNFDAGLPSILQKYEIHIRFFRKTHAYVPLDQYGIVLKIFTFYFRPLPLEKEGFLYTIISFENLILLLFSILIFFFSVKYFKILHTEILFVFPIILLLLFALMYVFAYANYGIIIRTKMMILPFLYVLILTVLSNAFSNYRKPHMS
jgi:hypothetical protein